LKAYVAWAVLASHMPILALAETPILVGPKNRVPDWVTVGTLEKFVGQCNPSLGNGNFRNIIRYYKRYGEAYGIRWDYAVFQMLVETDCLKFTGGVSRHDNNFAGLGAVVAGEPGERFNSVEEGVVAHLQHLLIYALRKQSEVTAAAPHRIISKRDRRIWEDIRRRVGRQLGRPAHFEDLGVEKETDTLFWAQDPGYWAKIFSKAQRFAAFAPRRPGSEIPHSIPVDFSGTWDTRACFGRMTLGQWGDRVSGYYRTHSEGRGWDTGIVQGRVQGKTLKGQWTSSMSENPAGGSFTCVQEGPHTLIVKKGKEAIPCSGSRR
jgi:hypothetical protein